MCVRIHASTASVSNYNEIPVQKTFGRFVRPQRDVGYGATALTNLAHALVAKEDYSAATEAYQQALTIRQELDQERLAMEALAGKARIALAVGKTSKALDYVSQILQFLENNSLDGCDEPFRVWLTCWQVLDAAQEDRAPGVLEQAYHLLDERAQQIQDAELRLSFLENVDAHRTLANAWKIHSARG
jgi:tetratricopeptide (TPR) repeat protein